jgi:trehalose 2-sulfotransferase
MLKGYDGYSGANLDFPQGTLVSKAFVVASSFRSGSSHLSLSLWETGLLGAPWEYFNFDNVRRFMAARLAPTSSGDYLRKLAAIRTSPNGVFSIKAHFRHFESALREYPPLLEVIQPVRFVYIDRRDKVAQAVSLARALQTNAWFAFNKQDHAPLFYSAEFIEDCLQEVLKQTGGWEAWFKERRIEPLVVAYEDLMADRAATVQRVLRYMGVEHDTPAEVRLPHYILKQSDGINRKWAERFRIESEMARPWAELEAAAPA